MGRRAVVGSIGVFALGVAAMPAASSPAVAQPVRSIRSFEAAQASQDSHPPSAAGCVSPTPVEVLLVRWLQSQDRIEHRPGPDTRSWCANSSVLLRSATAPDPTPSPPPPPPTPPAPPPPAPTVTASSDSDSPTGNSATGNSGTDDSGTDDSTTGNSATGTNSTPGYGCAAALAYLSTHAAPGFLFICPGYAGGHEAMTCDNYAPICPGVKEIVIADPCPVAYMNEASNSLVLENLSTAPIDPYGDSC